MTLGYLGLIKTKSHQVLDVLFEATSSWSRPIINLAVIRWLIITYLVDENVMVTFREITTVLGLEL